MLDWVLVDVVIFRVSGVKRGMKALLRRSLATAQHLRRTLVGLVDPGLVGIGLKGETRQVWTQLRLQL